MRRPRLSRDTRARPRRSRWPPLPTVPAEQPAPTVETIAAPYAATAKTIPVDQPTRYEAPTAETEPLGAAAAEGADGTRVGTAPAKIAPPPERPISRSRRVAVIVGVLVLLGAVAVGAVVLFNAVRPNVDGAAQPTQSPRPSATAPAETPSAEPVAPPPSASAPAPEEEHRARRPRRSSGSSTPFRATTRCCRAISTVRGR